MPGVSARNRFNTISAIQSADWMIDPLWAIANMDFINNIEQNKVDQLPGDIDTSLDNLKPTAYALENFSFASPNALDEAKPGSIMVMQVSGPMLRYGDWCSYGTEDFINWLEAAQANANIEGVLIEVNTPGGQVDAIPHLHSLVLNFPKPVVAWVDKNMMASAGVYAFIGADKVFASHVTDTIGSIGVYTRLRDVRVAMEKYGIKEYSIYAPQSTEKNSEIRQLFEEGKTDLIEASLAFLADNFIQAVENARGDKLKVVEGVEWKKGRLLYANQALEIGLIDGIVSRDEAVNELVNLINQNKSTTAMFGDKHKILTSMAGVAAADVQDEQLNEINSHLDGLNIKGVRVVNAGWITEAETNATNLATVQAQLKKAVGERDEWKQKAEAFGKQPGEKPSIVKSENEGEPIKEGTKIVSETDVALAKMKGTFDVR